MRSSWARSSRAATRDSARNWVPACAWSTTQVRRSRTPRSSIDFSVPRASCAALRVAADAGVAYVCGTTGFSASERADLDAAAARIPIVWAPNFSVAVHVLAHLVGTAARAARSRVRRRDRGVAPRREARRAERDRPAPRRSDRAGARSGSRQGARGGARGRSRHAPAGRHRCPGACAAGTTRASTASCSWVAASDWSWCTARPRAITSRPAPCARRAGCAVARRGSMRWSRYSGSA